MRAWLSLALLLAGAAPGYKHVGGRGGVEVYRLTSSPVIDLWAEGDIDAPPAVVRDVLLDYANANALSPRVAESRVLERGEHDAVVYQRLNLPVIADRDFTIRVKWGDARGGV